MSAVTPWLRSALHMQRHGWRIAAELHDAEQALKDLKGVDGGSRRRAGWM